MADLVEKRVLVTGAASGIGREIAEVFTEHGARVMLADIDDEGAAKAAAQLDGAQHVTADVSQSKDVQRAIDATVKAFGGLDVLVNNAGIEQLAALTEHDEDDFDKIVSINFRGVFLGIKYGAPVIAAGGGGAIVNMASVAGLGGAPYFGAYGATKAAVIGLTQTAAIELRDVNVRVNALCPAFIETPMVARAVPILAEPLTAALNRPIETVIHDIQGRLGSTREVAEAAVFLASDRASFVNGVAFAVDNALTARLI
jgi:NAD(P)-dependent dehydrogenase (short-subunit alcohol dehydrogenase family)